ncbi:Ig-like domain repeat protein [Streptomyces sp. NPDC048623]|uniref:Ig-like domain repeat protein n=1 Tax=Streptomyces sp. NPDC048623 TaxID=3155761 RepID=UPI00343CBF48
MLKNRISRALALGVAAVTTAFAAGLATAGAAYAAPIGTLDIAPATGADTSGISFTTSGACPDTATNVLVKVEGSGFPAGGLNVVGNSPITTYPKAGNGGMIIPLTSTMRDYASQAGFTTLQGRYDFTVICRTAFNGTSLGDFTGAIWFTSNTTYQANDPAVKTDTTTSLAVTPAGPAQAGSPVTLTATVTPSGAAGTVQFKDGSADFGTPVTVNGGTATLTTSNLTAGTHALTAVFTPDSASYNGSTSAAVSYEIKPAAATQTSTALAVSPASGTPQYSPVTLTGTVTPAGAAGSLKFTDTVGGTAVPLGTVPVSGGTATLTTSSLAAGAHSFTAVFVPADPARYTASDSNAIPYTVGAFAGVTASESITTTVNAGALVISVDAPQVTLPSPVLNADGDLLTTAGALSPVTLTDTRAGNPGWTVSGQVTDFSDGATHTINGQNLGWSPKVVDKAPAQTVTPGSHVAAARGVAPGDAGSDGLKAARTLANGTGLGTAHIGADLALSVPTSTQAGTYTTTLTLTAI